MVPNNSGQSSTGSSKPHAVCTNVASQSHIKAMLKLAKILHYRGFHITIVNTISIHERFLKSHGPNYLDGVPDFCFETIPDPDDSAPINHPLAPFRDLLKKLNNTSPPVTCIVSNGFMSTMTITAAEELGVPIALFFSFAACSFMGFMQFRTLLQKGLAPLKDESCLTNGYLDKVIDWIPGMKDIRLKHLPTFFRTTNPDDKLFNLSMETTEATNKASAVIFLTFDTLEKAVLEALSCSLSPPVYTIGPLQLLLNRIPEDHLEALGYSLLREDTECLQWLNSKLPNSVVYVNFGSMAVLTSEQLLEFAWGLANTKLPFFWVIRPDLVAGKSAILQPEFEAETKDRGLIASWCPQEKVLNHPSVGGFLTHSGWNSTMESITSGVPILCWPYFADQQTNSYFSCNEWGIGLEIPSDVRREDVEILVKELMEGEKSKKLKDKVLGWKRLAEEATAPLGSSSINLDNLVSQVLLRNQ